MRYLLADKPLEPSRVVLPRVNDVEYHVSHRNGHFFVLLRDAGRPNSELLVAPVASPQRQTPVLRHREDVQLESIVVSRNYVATLERKGGLQGEQAFYSTLALYEVKSVVFRTVI